MQKIVFAGEEPNSVAKCHQLAEHSCYCSSLDAHTQPEDENRVDNGIGGDCENGQAHSGFRIA